MKPWDLLGRTCTPEGDDLTLMRRSGEYVIFANGKSLMSSRMHGSEEALRDARLPAGADTARAARAGRRSRHGLHAARHAGPASRRGDRRRRGAAAGSRGVESRAARRAGRPAAHGPARAGRNRRCRSDAARRSGDAFDAVLLDVDNGPAAFTSPANAGLYSDAGVAAIRAALTAGRRARGVVGVGRPPVRAAAALRPVHRAGRARARPPRRRAGRATPSSSACKQAASTPLTP